DRVTPVPQREPETEPLLDVAESGQAVLAPPVRSGSGVVVREVCPGLAVGAVVLPNGAPLPLADVRPPEVPVVRLAQSVFQLSERSHPFPLSRHRRPRLITPELPTPDDAMDGPAEGRHPPQVSR